MPGGIEDKPGKLRYGHNDFSKRLWEPATHRLQLQPKRFWELAPGAKPQRASEAPVAPERVGFKVGDEANVPVFGGFMPKRGVTPSQALLDIFAHPDRYRMECATATWVIYHRAILDLIGPHDFDRVFGDMMISMASSESALAPFLEPPAGSGDSKREATPELRQQVVAGDRVYIDNPDVSSEGAHGGFGGQNAFQLGDGNLVGHPFGFFTESGIKAKLNAHRVDNPKVEARLSAASTRLGTKILAEDLEPE
jgi:hypothetical protein